MEISYKIRKIAFDEGNKFKIEINLSYLLSDDIIRWSNTNIVEFTFDYQAKELDESNEMLLEEFLLSTIRNADKFLSLQKGSIADLDASSKKQRQTMHTNIKYS